MKKIPKLETLREMVREGEIRRIGTFGVPDDDGTRMVYLAHKGPYDEGLIFSARIYLSENAKVRELVDAPTHLDAEVAKEWLMLVSGSALHINSSLSPSLDNVFEGEISGWLDREERRKVKVVDLRDGRTWEAAAVPGNIGRAVRIAPGTDPETYLAVGSWLDTLSEREIESELAAGEIRDAYKKIIAGAGLIVDCIDPIGEDVDVRIRDEETGLVWAATVYPTRYLDGSIGYYADDDAAEADAGVINLWIEHNREEFKKRIEEGRE